MTEEDFKALLLDALSSRLPKDCKAEADADIYYSLTINNRLDIEQDPKNPKGGESSLTVSILISRLIEETPVPRELPIPKVVIDLSQRANDALAYSFKAMRHKEVYPYIRYGIILLGNEAIPKLFFRHLQGIDFAIAVPDGETIPESVIKEITRQVNVGDKLEMSIFGEEETKSFSMEPVLRKAI